MIRGAISRHEVVEDILRLVHALGTRRDAAKRLGVSGAYLSDVLNGKREPAGKLLTTLGYRRVLVFERIRSGADDGSAR
jgi:transcriptional regulator with XRE-family HTH domain